MAVVGYSSIILGASGSVGRNVVKGLLLSSNCNHITTVGRRSLPEFEKNEKITQHVIEMSELEDQVSNLAKGHQVAFCIFGIGKPTGTPQDEIEKIEITYVGAFARGCKNAGIERFQLMTGAGADPKSSLSILQVYAKKEEIVKQVGFPYLSIFRPSVILGNNNTPGVLNYLFPLANLVLPSDSNFRGINEKDLAKSFISDVELNRVPQNALNIFEYKDIKALSDQLKLEL